MQYGELTVGNGQRWVQRRPPRYSKIVRLNLRKRLQARLKIPQRTLYSRGCAFPQPLCSSFSLTVLPRKTPRHNRGIRVFSLSPSPRLLFPLSPPHPSPPVKTGLNANRSYSCNNALVNYFRLESTVPLLSRDVRKREFPRNLQFGKSFVHTERRVKERSSIVKISQFEKSSLIR